MIEHRLIERMIEILKMELEKIKNTNDFHPFFIDNVVDFIRTYADQTHHGKEEDILFRELQKKDISKDHKKIMNELIEEHIFGRRTTGELTKAKIKYVQGDINAMENIIDKINVLIEFYPKHIEKEDKHFFIPIMDYFTEVEQDAMNKEFQAFDRKMIHKKYDMLITIWEDEHALKGKQKSDWIDYV
ncbi:MAG: hemerythrin domain-containing protein [Promethearchaeota archaeon]